MKLAIHTSSGVVLTDLDKLAAQYQGTISIGQKCKHVWNTVAIDDESVDPFQCQIIGVAGNMKLKNGQNRTECPKGLLSSKLVPCNGCTGRCVNVHAGRPKFYQHDPSTETLINGNPVGQWGTELQVGDELTFGSVTAVVIA